VLLGHKEFRGYRVLLEIPDRKAFRVYKVFKGFRV
jgi:hypothetical protein